MLRRYALFLSLGVFLSFSAQGFASPYSKVLSRFLAGQQVSQKALQKALWAKPVPLRNLRLISPKYLRFTYNAIFAVKQARFRSEELRRFFRKQRWYRPNTSPAKIRLNQQAKQNLTLILQYEKKAIQRETKRALKRLVGATPEISIRGGGMCYDYPKIRVFQGPEMFHVTSRPSGPCIRPKGSILQSYPRKSGASRRIFRGKLPGALVFLLKPPVEADAHLLRVRSIHEGKILFKVGGLPASPVLRFDKRKRHLMFPQELKTPRACRRVRAACWPRLQEKYPVLRGASFPKKSCTCDPRFAPNPHVFAFFRWSMLAPQAKPRATKHVFCECKG
ncbi:MAG: YARHG domain-containing protein [Myxococcales bacterium]|nr:YARHG domain-containing protein [Myxococcales bacterium]